MNDLDYTVRESTRAKRVRITISPRSGLEVVIPRGFDRNLVPTLLEEKRVAIEKAFMKTEELRRHLHDEANNSLPGQLHLSAIGERWEVEYRVEDAQYVTLEPLPGNRLVVSGALHCRETVSFLMQRWLKKKALASFRAQLHGTAYKCGFEIGNVSIRVQKRRWGSCSAAGNISLNMKLLFLPGEAVDYVLMHELCHTVHPNHSPEFWALLESHLPDYRTGKAVLKESWRYVPVWLDPA